MVESHAFIIMGRIDPVECIGVSGQRSIVRNYIFRGLKKVSEKDRKNYTVPAAISELEKITIVKNSKEVYIRRYGLTKKQKNIYKQFGVTESCINKVAEQMNSRL